MKKSTGLTLLFVLIFLVGVLGFVAHINLSLKNASTKDLGPMEHLSIESESY